MFKARSLAAAIVLCMLTVVAYAPSVVASQANSTNYGVSEVQFGSGGVLHACSTTYCSKQTAGDLTVGNSKSTNYQAQAGGNTAKRDPFLEVTVSGGTINLGVLDSTTVATSSMTFSVKTYLASGYNVYIDGVTPTNKTSNHALTTMATATTSSPGTEQFGINLRQNSSPAVGANPVQVPDSSFSFGTWKAGYGTINNFKYVAGQSIAGSTSSSGETDYTMSMIANIATTTGGGSYNGRLVLNVIPTF